MACPDENVPTVESLQILTTVWSDNARYKNSSGGANICDFTLRSNKRKFPMIRGDNMEDLTCDMPIENFFAVIGNESKKRSPGSDFAFWIFRRPQPPNLLSPTQSQTANYKPQIALTKGWRVRMRTSLQWSRYRS